MIIRRLLIIAGWGGERNHPLPIPLTSGYNRSRLILSYIYNQAEQEGGFEA
jgi:hypothetical protein